MSGLQYNIASFSPSLLHPHHRLFALSKALTCRNSLNSENLASQRRWLSCCVCGGGWGRGGYYPVSVLGHLKGN
ncbi:hypothetical protein KY285_010226 [Solanum tuberosum]|nr:hypothetical protein KY289_010758 [Solanum tuberosum]KAH0734519.1 hypothetical protein KY285_010226 [Solanum tuberosum]